jgi:hypothetical protein
MKKFDVKSKDPLSFEIWIFRNGQPDHDAQTQYSDCLDKVAGGKATQTQYSDCLDKAADGKATQTRIHCS